MHSIIYLLITILLSINEYKTHFSTAETDVVIDIQIDNIEYKNSDIIVDIPIIINKQSTTRSVFVYNRNVNTYHYFTLQEFVESVENVCNCKFYYLLTDTLDKVIPINCNAIHNEGGEENNSSYVFNEYRLLNLKSHDTARIDIRIELLKYYCLKKGYYKVHLIYCSSSKPFKYCKDFLSKENIEIGELLTYNENYVGSFRLHVIK